MESILQKSNKVKTLLSLSLERWSSIKKEKDIFVTRRVVLNTKSTVIPFSHENNTSAI